MKKIIFLCLSIFTFLAANAQYQVAGAEEYGDNLTGTNIHKVFVVNGLSGAELKYTSSSASAQFFYYTNSLADKLPVPAGDITSYTSGGETIYTIRNLIDSKGYYAVESGVDKLAAWIIDYSLHHPVLNSITPIEDADKCQYLKLGFSITDDLSFFGTTGVERKVNRKYTIAYENLVWNDTDKRFDQETVTEENVSGTETVIEAPLLTTEFTLSGDQFAQAFGIDISLISSTYEAVATEAHIVAEIEKTDGSLEDIDFTTPGLLFSAPAKIYFDGYANEPTTQYYDWRIYRKLTGQTDWGTPIARFSDREFYYVFEQHGDFKIELEVANQHSECPSIAQVTFAISESALDQPNFFSPGDSPGSNDEWRVAHKSIVKFRCTIFNRWGVKLFQFTDPDKGWDGRYKGKRVNPGVYFYVIEATGADGRKYKRSGDINILK
ncbi:gliding motility-associated C-terminal domain-containing protein [Dysgonomonas sp. 25]|uniref:T9SS type B sorting domain-containing protein n=1 Tax=Dysgonomonas sp. 25 TaxID=2302933 RepID=UPI0013D5C947|nr:gliding motility-associated C-terminal domain-containing protein [Dysgonomonas sp. 25]NDV68392.1 gliding motility-associated C-terminal domain-containing protein [Dysgonomonas sp. 25]